MPRRKKIFRRLAAALAVACLYPAWVFGYTWSHVLNSDLEGGRHGPLDAYRHALASAVVSHTLGEWAVTLVTRLFESRGKDSNIMDAHNNRIGARIGATAPSFAEIEPAVQMAVRQGKEGAVEGGQITWLERRKWRTGAMW